MEKKESSEVRTFRTGDPRSVFRETTKAEEVLKRMGYPRTLLSTSSKTNKSVRLGVSTKVMYLSPGVLCPAASPLCLANCLGHTSGRMGSLGATAARDRRTAFYIAQREAFLQVLVGEIFMHLHEAHQQGMTAAVRLNGTSDIDWAKEHPELFRMFPAVEFYDYTKRAPVMMRFLRGGDANGSFPKNYHLTYSLSEANHGSADEVLRSGGNVAVVFWPETPRVWKGVETIDGDATDIRYLDKSPRYVALTAKGIARSELRGFVVQTGASEPKTLSKRSAA